MSAAAPTLTGLAHGRLRIPAAAFEVLAYLVIVSGASLAFLAGWLSVNGAVVLTVLLLGSLIVLSWINLGQGRHPVFLFLCTLMFFQGGRLLAYCLGADVDPMHVEMMQVDTPFSIGNQNSGIVLLCLCLSAICIYAPCRWKFASYPPPSTTSAQKYLPYLYLLFFLTIPFQLYRNYAYFEWIQQHGGYFSLFQRHEELASSVPLIVRAVPLISFPAFIAIFVFEHRRKAIYLVTAMYLASASLLLFFGSRMAFFRLILTLWYVARVKSSRKPRIVLFALFLLSLILVADVIGQFRENSDEPLSYSFLPVTFLAVQGQSLDVTSVAVAYRSYFQPYIWRYLANDLQNAFVAIDTAHYSRGRELGFDIPVLLNVQLFREGIGTGSSYIGEAYLLGGIVGVAGISLLIGFGLQYLYTLSRGILALCLVALTLPEVLFAPRGTLLDWVSALLRNVISIALMWAGWKLYNLLYLQRTHPVGEGLSPRVGQP